MKIARLIIIIVSSTFTISVLYLNIRLSLYDYKSGHMTQDIIHQLNFLEHELKHHQLGERMQALFPEGLIFINALYGLAWSEIAFHDTNKKLKKKALKEALYAYQQINSPDARQLFDPELKPTNGIFYLGWNNYLLSKVLQIDTSFEGYKDYKIAYMDNCELIASALKQSKTPYLQSYQNQCWPADMCVAMASLSNYNRLYDERYNNIIAQWINDVKTITDPVTSLVPHSVDAINGHPVEGARGSSISLIIRLLSEVDTNFAKEQYKIYKQNFSSTTLGLPSILEYPRGLSGQGDIDSGPVILDVGFAGTIVSIGTYAVMSDYAKAEQQFQTVNTFGLGFKTKNKKKYLFGKIPIADAFIAWSRTALLQDQSKKYFSNILWPIKFHLLSVMAILIPWILLFRRKILHKSKMIYNYLNRIASNNID